MNYLFLFIAIIFEIIGTTFMKMSNGFSLITYTLATAIAYVICFSALAQALKTIDVSIAYATWSALGLTIIALIGFTFFHETFNGLKVLFLIFIIVGVVGLNLCGAKH